MPNVNDLDFVVRRSIHDFAEEIMDFAAAPAIAKRRFFADQLADAALGALANVAAASPSTAADLPARLESIGAYGRARSNLAELIKLLDGGISRGYYTADLAADFRGRAEELTGMLVALSLSTRRPDTRGDDRRSKSA